MPKQLLYGCTANECKTGNHLQKKRKGQNSVAILYEEDLFRPELLNKLPRINNWETLRKIVSRIVYNYVT